MSNKVSLPKGMRDFNPQTVRKRRYIIDCIQSVFELYGYQPIETPVMEKLTTLNGKGGAESDKLLFKVLNSGAYLDKVPDANLTEKDQKAVTPFISEKGLRYDLTVPLARYVVMNQNEISFPFKRYQIQPVWRADRPQRGRYREFWQCDADVLGSTSLLNEVDLMTIFSEVYDKLGIQVKIHISSRKLLSAMAEILDKSEDLIAFTVILDKLDKIGKDKVIAELEKIGFDEKAAKLINDLESAAGDFLSSDLANQLSQTEDGKAGLEELKFILAMVDSDVADKLYVDPTLARGLDYYTGPIFEIKTADFPGSIGSGGRYDNLTGQFGLPNVSGVGISFGLDRMYDVMEQSNLFVDQANSSSKVLLINFDAETQSEIVKMANALRKAGIPCETYPDPVKMKKQMKFANDNNIPFVIMAGSRELESGMLTLKNMESGEQDSLTIQQIIEQLKHD